MRKTKDEIINEAYRKVADKHPEINDKRLLELLTRKYIMRNKLIKAGVLFLLGGLMLLCGATLGKYDSYWFVGLLAGLAMMCGALFEIIAVFMFAKAMHGPLTPDEKEELKYYDDIEKGGKPEDVPAKYDNSSYIEYEKNRYENASPVKKPTILFGRLSLFLKLFILIVFVIGLFNTIYGVYNVLTYEERNKNSVEVVARVIDMETQYDSNDNVEIKYTYEYSFGGKTYTMSETSSPGRDYSKTILIDSKNPSVVIYNDGKTSIMVGIIALFVSIFLLVYSLLKVRKMDGTLSILSLLWLGFAAAAIAFAIVGVYTLRKGEILGGCLFVFVGCPVWILAALLFRKVFDK